MRSDFSALHPTNLIYVRGFRAGVRFRLPIRCAEGAPPPSPCSRSSDRTRMIQSESHGPTFSNTPVPLSHSPVHPASPHSQRALTSSRTSRARAKRAEAQSVFWEAARITKKRHAAKLRTAEYLVEWKGTDASGTPWRPSWEPAALAPRPREQRGPDAHRHAAADHHMHQQAHRRASLLLAHLPHRARQRLDGPAHVPPHGESPCTGGQARVPLPRARRAAPPPPALQEGLVCAAADRRGAIALCGYSCLKHKGLGARLVTRRDPRRGPPPPRPRAAARPRARAPWTPGVSAAPRCSSGTAVRASG